MGLPRAVSRVGRCCHPLERNPCGFDGTGRRSLIGTACPVLSDRITAASVVLPRAFSAYTRVSLPKLIPVVTESNCPTDLMRLSLLIIAIATFTTPRHW